MSIRPLEEIAAEFKAAVAELEAAIFAKRDRGNELSAAVGQARHRTMRLRGDRLAPVASMSLVPPLGGM